MKILALKNNRGKVCRGYIFYVINLSSAQVVFFIGIIFIAYTIKGLLVPLLARYVGNHLHIEIAQKSFNRVTSLMLMIGGLMLMIK
ncbi:hypothetical protein [Sulfuriflexus mobilis]|uniref:hypothetical protein n=1 Tax=Sulfuriflexus mobilis TaxID=1811807 RepID=UPI000F83554E|nr:hypothetical protein [Sulfuriflexus mobilis]